MNNNILGGLQIINKRNASGLVETRSLDHLLATKPYEMGTILSQIFGNYKGEEVNVLDAVTRGLGRVQKIEIDAFEYDWGVEMAFDESNPIVRAEWNGATVTSTDFAGLNNTTVNLYVKNPYYGVGAILSFDNRDIQVRVQSPGFQFGESSCYSVVMADGNPESYIPYKYLVPGKRVAREGSAYEEGSNDADILNYNNSVKLRNKITTSRMKYDITRSAATTKTIVEWIDPKSGKKSYFFTDKQKWTAWREWYRRLDNYNVYSRYNTRPDGTVKVFGTNGRPVHVGAGLFQQFSPANNRPYTRMTPSFIMDMLSDLSYNKLGKGERKFLALTGEMGMRNFSQMLETKAANFQLTDTVFVSGSGQNLTLGGQFTTWKLYNDIELTVAPFRWLDDPSLNRIMDPLTRRPASSQDMYFLDIGHRDGEANLRKIVKMGSENLVWHTGGSIAPDRNTIKDVNTLRSNGYDGYTVNFLTEGGIMLADASTCGVAKYNVI